MQFGVMTEPQFGGTYRHLLAVARAAEAAGFDVFARSDHYLNMEAPESVPEALTSLAGLARDTDRIALGVLVTPVTFRHPAVIAKTAATIDQMSDGRFELGVGTGWMESEHEAFGLEMPPLRTRYSLMFDTLAYLSAAFGRTEGGFQGRHYRLADIEVQPRPTGTLPLVVGGKGMQRTPSLAGRFADHYNVFPSDAAGLQARRRVMQGAARDAGRDPDAVLLSLMSPIYVAEDRAGYREVVAAEAASRGIEASELEAHFAEDRVPHGTIDQVASLLAQYATEGVGRFYVQIFSSIDAIDIGSFPALLAGLRGDSAPAGNMH
ncbi:MAG: LLM class flavin-dependent oxidoreductase [Acidimicrobiia bacterium]|jgi:alkanesulfonate monooxygenase SsuD/methylene tetrahydromethanopterin reductase-like flavin-dependent oxidoreductase (luciferase family)